MEAAWRSRRKVPLLRQAAGPSPPPWKQRRGAEESGGGGQVSRQGPGHPPGRDEAPSLPAPFSSPVLISLSSLLPFPSLPSLLLEGSRPQCLAPVPGVDGGFAQGSSCPQPVVSQEPCPAPPFLAEALPETRLYV